MDIEASNRLSRTPARSSWDNNHLNFPAPPRGESSNPGNMANRMISSQSLLEKPAEPIPSAHKFNKTSRHPTRVPELLRRAFASYPIFSTIAKFSHDKDIKNFVQVALPLAEAKTMTESIRRLACQLCFCLHCRTTVCNYVTYVCLCHHQL